MSQFKKHKYYNRHIHDSISQIINDETCMSGTTGATGATGTTGATGLTGVTGPTGTAQFSDLYVFSYSTGTYITSTTGTFQTVPFDVNEQISGWTHNAGTDSFTCTTDGVYGVIYRIQASSNTGTNGYHLSLAGRATLNDVEIEGTQMFISTIQSSTIIKNFPMSTAFIIGCSIGDVLKIEFTSGQITSGLIKGGTVGVAITSSITIFRVE